MTQRWWDEPTRPSNPDTRRGPTPSFGQRPQQRRSLNPWPLSIVGYGIQLAACAAVLFAELLVGGVLIFAAGAAGADMSGATIWGLSALAVIVAEAVGIFFQVRYLSDHGATGSLSACVIAFVAATVVAGVVSLTDIPEIAAGVVAAVVQIVVVAVLIAPKASTR